MPSGTFGPYVGRDADQALLVWAAEEQAGARSWFALPVSASGAAAKPTKVGAAPADIGVVAVRGIGGGSFAVISTRRTASGERVEAMVIGPGGKLIGAPRALSDASVPVLWVDVATVGARRVALWAVKSEGGADVSAVALGATGEPAGEVHQVALGVRAWQAVSVKDAVALGVVRAGREKSSGGSVEVLWLGADAQALHSTTMVSSDSNAELDLDLALVGERVVVLWSDRRFGEARLMSAALAPDGSVAVPAAPFTAPLGEQALLRVIGDARKGYAVWENLSAAEDGGRALEIATFGPEARASEQRTRVTYAAFDGSLPEVSKLGDGLALLTISPACRQGKACQDEDAVPAYLELSSTLEVRAFEPLRLSALNGEAPDLAWGLSCGKERCFALAAQNEAPARVFLTELESASIGWQLPARRVDEDPAPRLVSSEVIEPTDALASIALAGSEQDGVIAWLTDFDPTTPWARLKTPTSDGRFDPLRSTLALAPLSAHAAGLPIPASAVTTLSLRAHSLGGIALAPAPGKREVVVGWAGFDAGQPQVFLTSVGADAKKREQRMLTRKKGGLSDIGLAPVADGYLVTWIDERNGSPEVFAAKVNPALNRVGNEQKLSRTGTAPAELVLTPTAAGALAVWSDATGSAQAGRADLYGLLLAAKDGAARGKELRLAETPLHSFSPALCVRGSEVVMGWVERAGEGETGSAAMLGVLDENGAWKQPPERIPLDGAPGALALDCQGANVRVAVTAEQNERTELIVFERGERASGPRSVARLPSGSRSQVQAVVRGDAVFVAEAAVAERARLRRLRIAWH